MGNKFLIETQALFLTSTCKHIHIIPKTFTRGRCSLCEAQTNLEKSCSQMFNFMNVFISITVDMCVDLTKCEKTNDQTSTIYDFYFINILYALKKKKSRLCIGNSYQKNLSGIYWITC